MYRFGVVLMASVLPITRPIAAQAQPAPVNFVIGGAYTAPNSEVRDHLGDGYNFNIGMQMTSPPVIGIEGLYSFNGLGDKRLSVPVSIQPIDGTGVPTDFLADMNMQFGGGANSGAFFAEARYHYIWGPTIEERPVQLPSPQATSTTTARKADGQFFVTTFGVRF